MMKVVQKKTMIVSNYFVKTIYELYWKQMKDEAVIYEEDKYVVRQK